MPTWTGNNPVGLFLARILKTGKEKHPVEREQNGKCHTNKASFLIIKCKKFI